MKFKGHRLLASDGRCDSVGAPDDKHIGMSLTQVTEEGNSNAMDKMYFEKLLNDIEKKGAVVKQMTTDRLVQMRIF